MSVMLSCCYLVIVLFLSLWISMASCSFGLEFCSYSLFLKLIHFKLAAYRGFNLCVAQ